MSDEMKTCPFCGGRAERRSYATGNVVGCFNSNCPINPEAGDCQTHERALTLWNTRAEITEGK